MIARSSIETELGDPDRLGKDLSRLRTRAYRFSDDPRLYVLVEWLEERFLAGQLPLRDTANWVAQCLRVIRETGQVLDIDLDILRAEGLELDVELAARAPYRLAQIPYCPEPQLAVAIVGAPRSGTSHLVNLIARSGHFSFFTTVSCWAWPVWNLSRPGRRLFDSLGPEVLQVDNRVTRLLPGLIMPGEAEDIYARAIYVYRHVAGHRYEILPPRPGDPELLAAAVAAHSRFFGRSWFLTKSPFNSFRIPQLCQIWGPATRFVHIRRDQKGTADSMRRNRFEFVVDGHLLSAEDAWSLFNSAIERDAPGDRLITVTHDDLLNRPNDVVTGILHWLDAGTGFSLPSGRS